MPVQRTLSILKPDAVAKGATGDILGRFEAAGLRIIALKRLQLTQQQARGFYAIHRERPFFESLVKFMTTGPVVLSVLEGEKAIEANRQLMGSTDSSQAEPGTIRGDWGTDIEKNAVHGSDSLNRAARSKVKLQNRPSPSSTKGPPAGKTSR